MSLQSQFTSKQNMNLLWDVFLDELHINTTNNSLMSNIKMVFDSNIKPFVTRINPKANLMDLNKQFLSQVVLAVNRLFPREQNIKRITITDEEVSEPYKIEDIHASRQTDFEQQFEKKRLELENYMTPQKPKELDFSDKSSDGKIKGMDSLVAEKMAQRELEIEQYQNSNYNTANIDAENWLSAKETSVKTEKMPQEPVQNRLKHLNIDKDNNISLVKEKKVTWNDNDSSSTANIFQKLKRRVEEEPTTQPVDKPQYIEQKSTPLPDIKQEQIIRNNVSTVSSFVPNIPIVPTNEIIKQMNEMNTKIDNLFEMVSKLTNLISENSNSSHS